MMIALEERESVLREKYLEFLRKFQDAKLAQSLESAQHGERFSLVDPAVEPTRPVRERSFYAAFGGIVSLALAFGVGILLEIRDPVLVSADQLELVSDLPVLGSVSRI
jgi:succinoglycan biosynthesis transport protein ExoP